MQTIKKAKTFEALKMMREIRVKVSDETQHMIFAELKECIQNKLKRAN